MTSPAATPFHREISALASFISIRQVIASPIFAGLSHLQQHGSFLFDVREILDFLAISFPLTLSIAILFVVIEKGKFNMFTLVFTIAGAALLSNLLHWVVEEIPLIGINKTLTDSLNYNDNRGGNSVALGWVGTMFSLYWKTFGPILFIQSCCIGIYAGYKYVKIEERKNAKNGKKENNL